MNDLKYRGATTLLRKSTLCVFALALLLSGHAVQTYSSIESFSSNGLVVVVTFPSLVNDVEQLLCSGDTVISIVPWGVDPHTYTLTPSAIDILRRANIIVSTGHTSFEMKIRELVDEGVIKGVLIEIPRINGIEIKKNPITGQPNYHMPIYDPKNYALFIDRLTNVFIQLRPECRTHYLVHENNIIDRLLSIIYSANKTRVKAVAESPVLQYAVEWLGVDIKYLMIREHDIPASAQDVLEIENALKNGDVKLVVVSEPVKTSAGNKLVDLAEKYNVPILYVPSPLTNDTMLHRIEVVVSRFNSIVAEINIMSKTKLSETSTTQPDPITVLTLFLGALVFSLTIVYIGCRRLE